MSNSDNGFNPLWLLWMVILFLLIFDDDDNKKEKPQTSTEIQAPEGAESPMVFEEKIIEGVIDRLIPATEGITIVVFDDGRQRELRLGDHQVHIGEWNQLRVNSQGYVEEVWLGENAIQDAARR